MMHKINVAIIGAAGLTGGELCRFLVNHPRIRDIYPVSRGDEDLDAVHPNLIGSGLDFFDLNTLNLRLSEIDVAFLSTPPGEAMKLAPALLATGVKVIDLSADFRFSDPKVYEKVYEKTHLAPHLLDRAVYGVTEFNREDIRSATLVANPGCYAITALLGLAPILTSEFISRVMPIHISAINGTSGAGGKPTKDTSHAMANDNVLPYNLEGHRHAPELAQQLEKLAGRQIDVVFSTAHGPFSRGIYAQMTVAMDPNYQRPVTRECVLDLFQSQYSASTPNGKFVKVITRKKLGKRNEKEYNIYPSVARVSGSNYCHIGIDVDRYSNTIKICSVADNLGKGAAGSAIQNMNVMLGFDEKEGIAQFGL